MSFRREAVRRFSLYISLQLAALIPVLILMSAGVACYGQEPLGRVPRSNGEIRLSFAPVVQKAAPAVVNVHSRRAIAQRSAFAGDPFFERFFGTPDNERDAVTLGSGVIVEKSGIIVTNHHVVKGAQELRIILSDRREFEAKVLLADERTDLAVLKVDSNQDLPSLNYAERLTPKVGDLVLAIGNPFGVGQTVTNGIVSALARTDVGITDYAFFIQTDAAVNPGNSGGALVDMNGELIGVNTAIYSRSGGSNGIGFAIPVEMVRTVVAAALKGDSIIRPWLGARLQAIDLDLAVSIGLDRPRGVIISELWPAGSAERSGLKQGDIILKIDNNDVNDEVAVRFRLATRPIGELAEFTVLRNGSKKAFFVIAEPAPGDVQGSRLVINQTNPFAGSELVELSPAFNENNGIDPFQKGVVIFNVNRSTVADYFGFKPGDRVIEIYQPPIGTLQDVKSILSRMDGQKQWPLIIKRGEREFNRVLRL